MNSIRKGTCTFCGQPVIINDIKHEVYAVGCNHEQEYFYYVGGEVFEEIDEGVPPSWMHSTVTPTPTATATSTTQSNPSSTLSSIQMWINAMEDHTSE